MSIIAPARPTWLSGFEVTAGPADMGVPLSGGNGSARNPVNLDDSYS
jgi:hypothetical protein